jgi:hypothetical protein
MIFDPLVSGKSITTEDIALLSRFIQSLKKASLKYRDPEIESESESCCCRIFLLSEEKN